MPVAEISSGLSRLMEALEKLGTSSGAGLNSPNGPSGQPSQELIQAFEDALQKNDAQPSIDALNNSQQPLQNNEQAQAVELENPQQSSEKIDADFHLWEVQTENIRIEPPSSRHDIAGIEQDIGSPEALNPQQNSAEPKQYTDTSFTDQIRELGEILNKMNTGALSPQDLYRMQYITGMLKVQTSAGVNVSQRTTQGFESLLKQQG
jgi:hypothetical protein